MQVRIAVLDMNDGLPNQGMRCIREIVQVWAKTNAHELVLDEFEVRQQLQVPDTSYDVYLSSGGPGSPLESIGSEWERNYFHWLPAGLPPLQDCQCMQPGKHRLWCIPGAYAEAGCQ